MARIVNSALMSRQATRLTPEQRRQALRLLAKAAQSNPLRRVRLDCHGWVRDASAVKDDWIWCEKCEDHRKVLELKA